MNETVKNESVIRQKMLKTFGDPVLLYTVLVMMTIMYHYHSKHTLIYGIISLIVGALLIRLYDFTTKHKLLGGALYIFIATLFLMSSRICMENGRHDYPLSFGVWFITPQVALAYSKWYTMAIYLLFMIFMSTVIYYFTRIRYRIFMSFMVTFIPFAIYGKEFEKMPVVFIILLCVGYFMLMVRFRQLNQANETVIVDRRETWKAVGAFAAIFAIIAAMIPKPQISANREFIDSMISADQFTEKLMSMLNSFRGDSSGGQFRNVNSDVPLYYANAKEPLRLKTSTFTSYNYASDKWSASYNDKTFDNYYKYTPVDFYVTNKVAEAVLFAAAHDKEFAEEYGLDKYIGTKFDDPEIRTMALYSVNQWGDTAPVPELVRHLISTTYEDEVAITYTGVLMKHGTQKFAKNEQFKFDYAADTFFRSERNKKVVDHFSRDDYRAMLKSAEKVLSDWDEEVFDRDGYTDEYDEILDHEFIIMDEINVYDDAVDDCLAYDKKQNIRELAESITEGLESDYDKARALESYFLLNNFIYDDEYAKGITENVESFLFHTKRGVCYEYATAMVLMARSLGIPARYCEGFNMQDLAEGTSYDFVITAKSAHGFPELYIRGFGWLSFEPTQTLGTAEDETGNATNMLLKAGLFILIAAVLLMLAVLLYPIVSHKIFISRCRKKKPHEAAVMSMHRLCRVYGIGKTLTSHEAADMIRSVSGADITPLPELFDSAVYGGSELDEGSGQKALDVYISAYEALRASKKRRNIRKSEKNGGLICKSSKTEDQS